MKRQIRYVVEFREHSRGRWLQWGIQYKTKGVAMYTGKFLLTMSSGADRVHSVRVQKVEIVPIGEPVNIERKPQ